MRGEILLMLDTLSTVMNTSKSPEMRRNSCPFV